MMDVARVVSVLVAVLFLSNFAIGADKEAMVQVLTSSARNVNVETWETTSRAVTPGSPVAWSVRKFKLHGGKQEGVDVIVIDNGKLQMAVCPTRGMGILWVTLGDVRLGWDSPVKETVDPRFVNLSERGGLGWLTGFNEFTCRCGLEWSGHPGTDKFINNVGDEATMDLTLHGKVANLPASEVEVVIEREAPYRIHVRGRVDERQFYGPKLEIWTDLSTEPGSSGFRISDVISNRGDAPQEFQILYHTNFGVPLLGEGAQFIAAIERITPFNAHAAEGMKTYDKYAGPTLGFVEQVYKIKPASDADGRTMAMLKSAKGDRAASLAFNVKQLPFLTQWKNTNAIGEGYVTGIEPGTSFPHNRRVERQHGRVPKLAAGESRSFEIDYAIHVGEAEVKQAAAKVAAIQGDRKPQADAEPEKID
jgi:galactose mutarotase-like enzyme